MDSEMVYVNLSIRLSGDWIAQLCGPDVTLAALRIEHEAERELRKQLRKQFRALASKHGGNPWAIAFNTPCGREAPTETSVVDMRGDPNGCQLTEAMRRLCEAAVRTHMLTGDEAYVGDHAVRIVRLSPEVCNEFNRALQAYRDAKASVQPAPNQSNMDTPRHFAEDIRAGEEDEQVPNPGVLQVRPPSGSVAGGEPSVLRAGSEARRDTDQTAGGGGCRPAQAAGGEGLRGARGIGESGLGPAPSGGEGDDGR